MALIIPGANITAQWYGDSFPGTFMPTWEKFLLHSTETNSWPGYGGGASMPTCTYHPRLRQLRQHLSADRSARALRNPSSTPVSENRDNVLQVEIVAYSDFRLARERGGLWIYELTDVHMEDLARIHIWMNKLKGTPLRTEVRWAPGVKTAAGVAGLRLTSAQYDRARGVLAHFSASGNEHWDVGGFDINRYLRVLDRLSKPTEPEEPDMPLTTADIVNVWEIKRWAEYEDEDNDGTRDVRAPIDMLFATHKFAVRAYELSQQNAKALAEIKDLLTEPEPVPPT